MHLHLPIVDLAVGGSLLTGWGGDQVLLGWPRPRRPAGRARSLIPTGLVAPLQQQRHDPFPWLRGRMSRRLIAARRRARRAEPSTIDKRIDFHTRRRDLHLACAGLAAIATDGDVQVIHPFIDFGFTAALSRRTRGRRDLSRSDLLRDISAGQFPDAATAERPKAYFLQVFLRAATRAFAENWTGTGADESIVNPGALQAAWQQWPIPGATAGLVQQLWLHSATRSTISIAE
jgi:asparagine synthase (glutamine-hydrolysing)